ncbi:hypothetical protein NADFUDRAFT_83399 [Nadsonia fulvescens var. elongata DSM 6958]|uniref:Uncharacterized protein n=1 Tax=Nadsonia fulvescens var. elongata DSM 6958 TaxID=857566 RepID=A0A1E3PJ27_9ASCO|nr:hypothetical protein NADFUDRAFT_83399 [Nadsonia fulvescens var. elongata DSM 6958]
MDSISSNVNSLGGRLETIELSDDNQAPVANQTPIMVNPSAPTEPITFPSMASSYATAPIPVVIPNETHPDSQKAEPRKGIRQQGGYLVHSVGSLAYNMGRQAYASFLGNRKPEVSLHRLRDKVSCKLKVHTSPSVQETEPVVSMKDCHDGSDFTNVSLGKLTYAEVASINQARSAANNQAQKPIANTTVLDTERPDTANFMEAEANQSTGSSNLEYTTELDGFEYDIEEYYHRKVPGTRKKNTLKKIGV